MKALHVVSWIACLSLGCGSGAAGSLDGKIQGHEIAVKEAIYVSLPDGETFVAAADQEDLCAIMNGQKQPTGEMNLLEIYLLNWNGTSAEPLISGTYVMSRSASEPGQWSFPLVSGREGASPSPPPARTAAASPWRAWGPRSPGARRRCRST